MYKVRNEQFEGPLDLLLSLIEKEQLDITQIALSKITGEYLKMIGEIEGNADELADFLVIAAKLLYIKSRELIPTITTDEEEAEIEDLETKLREYGQVRAAAKHLETVMSAGGRSYARRAQNETVISFAPPTNIGSDSLFAIFQEILNKVQEESPKQTEITREPIVTLEEKREYIIKHIASGGKASFRKILGSSRSKNEIIVTFLAILEMVKQKEIRVEQTGNFSDFYLYGVQ